MKAVFADTAYYLALVSPKDQHHAAAVAWSRALRVSIITTNWVLTEVADGLSNAAARTSAVRLIELLRADPNTTIVPNSATLFDRGFELYRTRPDKDWSLTDCVSFVVMSEHSLSDALTTDHHFEQAGFRALLREDPN